MHAKPFLTCWQDSLLKPVFLCGPCGFLGNMCQQPLITVIFITVLPVTGTSGWTEPTRPLGLLPLPRRFNITLIVNVFPSLPFPGDYSWSDLHGQLQSDQAQDMVQPQPQQRCCAALTEASMGPSACEQLPREQGAGPVCGFL